MSQFDLVLRPTIRREPPLLLVTRRSKLEISPGGTESEFVFDVEAPHGGIRKLELSLDSALRPSGVTIRGLDRWEMLTTVGAGGSNRLVVMLTEPLTAGPLTLRAASAAPSQGRWTCPSAELVGGIPRGEELSVRVHPDLTAEDWRPGTYRHIATTTRADHWQEATFRSGMIRSGTGFVSCRLRMAGPQYRTTEHLWCQARTDRISLTARISFEVARGAVFDVPLTLPEGWDVARVEAEPPDLLAPTTPKARAGLLHVSLQRPLTPTALARLTIHLTRRPPRAGEVIPFPDVVPVAATARVGFFAMKVGPGLELASPASPPTADTTGAEQPPWGDDPPDYVFLITGTPIGLGLRNAPHQGRVRARTEMRARVVGERAEVDCRVRLEPVGGSPQFLLFRERGSLDGWDWRVADASNRVRSVRVWPDPLPILSAVLSAGSPWHALTALSARASDPASFWQVALIRPLTEPIELDVAAEIRRPQIGSWRIPLLDLPAAEQDRNEIHIDCRFAPGWDARGVGVDEIDRSEGGPWRRAFKYGDGPATLTLVPRSSRGQARAEEALLVVYAGLEGRLIHSLRYRLRDWERLTSPLELPPNATIRQVLVDGKTARPQLVNSADGGLRVEVPVLTERRSQAVEVVYETQCPVGHFISDLDAVVPSLPCPVDYFRKVWCLPTEQIPFGRWNVIRPDDASRTPDSALPADLTQGAYWESATDGGARIRIIRRRSLHWAGALAGFVLLAGAHKARQWPARRQWVAVLVWTCVAGVACVWPPAPWPIFARWSLGAALFVVIQKILAIRKAFPTKSESSLRVGTLGAVLFVTTLSPIEDLALHAAAKTAALVYLIPAADNPGEPQSVLLPTDLFDRLQAEVRRGRPGSQVAWQEAYYEGRVAGGQARFTAELRLHSFVDDPPPAVLPLNGVQLRDATIDGSPAFLRSMGDHYLVPIRGRGPHSLRLAFDTVISAYPPPAAESRPAGADRQIEFIVPEVPTTRLSFTAPAATTHLQSITGRGGQRVVQEVDRPRLEVDLGRSGAVHLRWQTETANPRPATVRIKESYLWDLNDANARLLASIRYEISPGSVSALGVGVPNDLEVVGVVARPLDAPAADAGTGWLREWHIDAPSRPGGRQSLVLDFGGPIGRRWQVNLELVPRETFAPAFALPFLSPGGTRSAPPVFAWRASELDLTDTPPQTAIPLTAEAFLRDHWLPTKAEADPRPPTKAYQRTGVGQAPALRLRVRPDNGARGPQPKS
jgi:hypothetical protein